MRNIWTIARRDFRSYFASPIGYIVVGGFMILLGFMFANNLVYFVQQGARNAQFGMGKAPSVTEGVLRPLFQNINVIFLFFVPFITMRLFAEEKKLHTLELLITSPVRLGEIVLGKFLSAFLFVAVMMLATATFPIVLFVAGSPDVGSLVTNYLGIFLISSCYLSVGILFSSMTDNQIVAAALTFAACLFMWLISWAAQSVGPVFSDLLNYLSLINHFQDFNQGSIDTSNVIFYLSFSGIFLFLTHRVLDSFRWR